MERATRVEEAGVSSEVVARAVSGPCREDPSGEAVVDHRPWGSFERLCHGEEVTVKIIAVDPGHRLSLQRHRLRDEYWTVLDVPLLVEVDGALTRCEPGDKVWIPRGSTHRVSNPGEVRGRFLEIAYGTFDEDDIERLADDYARDVH
ncbi:phosphomannose isomerase type II C-terminal cupin domain [Vallicoccus soli]|uniref:Cupin domain-containing protein n=1 Tax=Vallicoccus soli TaxID=2339232 RepID=A0A3A3ZHR6_9ACTN|nr:phosphomannose isomerase type II C-terminal cupin domain [Vallicoccus soli]RJK94836.1 cupin domain-containing protein [Vallicoccus soli]